MIDLPPPSLLTTVIEAVGIISLGLAIGALTVGVVLLAIIGAH